MSSRISFVSLHADGFGIASIRDMLTKKIHKIKLSLFIRKFQFDLSVSFFLHKNFQAVGRVGNIIIIDIRKVDAAYLSGPATNDEIGLGEFECYIIP